MTAALHKYQHKPAQRPKHSPHKWEQPIYGKTTNSTRRGHITSTNKVKKNRIQFILGTLRYDEREVEYQ